MDATGKHVYGLKAEDFQLFDRGKPRPIATFQEIDGEAPGASIGPVLPATVHRDVATNQPIRNDRLVVVVVDDVHIYRGRTDQAKAIARDIVGKLGVGRFHGRALHERRARHRSHRRPAQAAGGGGHVEGAAVVSPAAPGARQPDADSHDQLRRKICSP